MIIEYAQQGGTAPAPPPIPALPSRPGEVTGTQTTPAAIAGSGTSDAIALPSDARTEVRNAIRDQVRDALRQGQGGQAGTLVPPFREPDIPPEVIPLVGMTLGLLVAMIVGYPIARAIGRVIERRGEVGVVRAAEVVPQLRQLQESVDAMAIELERIGEAQRFSARLMAQRAPPLPGSSAPPA